MFIIHSQEYQTHRKTCNDIKNDLAMIRNERLKLQQLEKDQNRYDIYVDAYNRV